MEKHHINFHKDVVENIEAITGGMLGIKKS